MPLSAFRPLGTSIHIMSYSEFIPEKFFSLITSITFLKNPSNSLFNPTPNIASTTISAFFSMLSNSKIFSSEVISVTRAPSFTNISKFIAAIPL